MKKFIFLTAVAVISFASCQKEAELIPSYGDNEMVPFEVTLNTEVYPHNTKAWLDNDQKTILWANNDEFGVFDGVNTADGGSKFTVATKSNDVCTLSGEISASATGPIYFLYPYQKYVATRGSKGDNTFTTNCKDGLIFPIQANYSYKTGPNQLPKYALTMVGKMSSKDSKDPIVMKTPLGFVKFHLTSSEEHPVTKIEITSQNSDVIGGTFAVDYSGDEPVLKVQGRDEGVFKAHPSMSGDPSTGNAGQQKVAYNIVITPSSGDSFPDGDYFFALPPQEYNWGIRMKFTDDMNYVAEKSGSHSLTITRGKIADLGTIGMDDLKWYETIDLNFMHAILDKQWPFNEDMVSTYTKDKEYTFTYGPDNDEFKFKCVGYDGGYWGQTGINIKGKYAYVQIPGRAGKKIHRVSLRVGAQGNTGGSASTTNAGNPVLGDAQGINAEGKYNLVKVDKSDGSFAWLTPETDNSLMDAWWGRKNYSWTHNWVDFDDLGERDLRIYTTATGDYLKIINLMVQYEDLEQE